MVGQPTKANNLREYSPYTSQQLALTYSKLVTSELVLNGAVERLGLDMDWRSLQGRVSSNHILETELFELTLVDSDPNRAKIFLDAIASILPTVRQPTSFSWRLCVPSPIT